MIQDIATIITDLRSRMAALPRIDGRRGDVIEQHQQLRAQAHALGDYLSITYGARVTERPEINRIKMCGITSSSTSGLTGAFGNWIAAAQKREHAVNDR